MYTVEEQITMSVWTEDTCRDMQAEQTRRKKHLSGAQPYIRGNAPRITLTTNIRNGYAELKVPHPALQKSPPFRDMASRLFAETTDRHCRRSTPPSVLSFRLQSLPYRYKVVFLALPPQDVPHSLPLQPLLASGSPGNE